MTRPVKYNEEVALKIGDFLRSGLTITDACYGANISDNTFRRWRDRYPEFNEIVEEASYKGWQDVEALAKYHYRGYTRKGATKRPCSANGQKDLADYSMHKKLSNDFRSPYNDILGDSPILCIHIQKKDLQNVL